MSTLLILRTSLNGANSFSNKMLDDFKAKTLAKYPETKIVERDLNADPVPMLDSETVAAIRAGVTDTAKQKAALALSDELVAELKSADYIAVGLPRYNFTVPATFKSYMDYIGRAGVTFSYGADGAKGLLPDVPVYAFIASGGEYIGTEADTMTPWLKQMLSFVGLNKLNIVPVEGVAYKADEAVAAAEKAVDGFLAA